jgi:hypothetical protein
MKSVAFASILLVTLVQTGCVCGAYDGGGNRVYQRNDAEMLILCDNGGFVAKLTDRTVEGFYTDNLDGTGIATQGEDGQLAFDAQASETGLVTPQLGIAPWTQMNLDATALDHSDVLCQDLQYRSWWTAQ